MAHSPMYAVIQFLRNKVLRGGAIVGATSRRGRSGRGVGGSYGARAGIVGITQGSRGDRAGIARDGAGIARGSRGSLNNGAGIAGIASGSRRDRAGIAGTATRAVTTLSLRATNKTSAKV